MRHQPPSHDRSAPPRRWRRTIAPLLVTGALAVGFVAAASGSAAADELPPLPVPLPIDVPPLPTPDPAPAPAPVPDPGLPVPAPTGGATPPSLPDGGVPTPTSGLPVPVPAGTPAPPSGAPDPTTAAAPLVAALSSAGGSGGDPADQLCGAVSTVGAVPTQVGTTAFLTVAPNVPPEVLSAVVPVLAGAGGSGAPDPGAVCHTIADTVTGVVGGVGGLPGAGGGATAPGAGGATAAPAAATAGGSGGGSGASLAFTGAETWMLALAGLALTVLGSILLRARRLARSVG